MPKKNISGKNVEIWKKPVFWILIVLGGAIIGVIIFLTHKSNPYIRKNCQGCKNEQCCNGKCIDTTKYNCINGSTCDIHKSCGNSCCNDNQSCNTKKDGTKACGKCENTVDTRGNITKINICTGHDTCCTGKNSVCKTKSTDKYSNRVVVPFALNRKYYKGSNAILGNIIDYNKTYYVVLKDFTPTKLEDFLKNAEKNVEKIKEPMTYCCNIKSKVADDTSCYNDVCNGIGCNGECYGNKNEKCCELNLSTDKKKCGVSCPGANSDNICKNGFSCLTDVNKKKNKCISSTCKFDLSTKKETPENYNEDCTHKICDTTFSAWKYSTNNKISKKTTTMTMVAQKKKDGTLLYDAENDKDGTPILFIADNIAPPDSKIVKLNQITQKDPSNNFCYEPKDKIKVKVEDEQDCINNKQYIWNSNAKPPYCSIPLIGKYDIKNITKKKKYTTKTECEKAGFIWNGCSVDDCSSKMKLKGDSIISFDNKKGICNDKVPGTYLPKNIETCPLTDKYRCCMNDRGKWTGQICPPRNWGTDEKNLVDQTCVWNQDKGYCLSEPYNCGNCYKDISRCVDGECDCGFYDPDDASSWIPADSVKYPHYYGESDKGPLKYDKTTCKIDVGSCPTFEDRTGGFTTGQAMKCNSRKGGGPGCKDMCCNYASDYCKKNCHADTCPIKCWDRCMTDDWASDCDETRNPMDGGIFHFMCGKNT